MSATNDDTPRDWWDEDAPDECNAIDVDNCAAHGWAAKVEGPR